MKYNINPIVGKATISLLENLCLDGIKIYWECKDYVKFNEYLNKYISLKTYNEVKHE